MAYFTIDDARFARKQIQEMVSAEDYEAASVAERNLMASALKSSIKEINQWKSIARIALSVNRMTFPRI